MLDVSGAGCLSSFVSMKFGYKLLALELLIAGYVVLFFRQIVSEPFGYGRLLALFVAGTLIAIFMQGPTYGNIQPISTRAIWATLGVVIMVMSVVWGFALKGH